MAAVYATGGGGGGGDRGGGGRGRGGCGLDGLPDADWPSWGRYARADADGGWAAGGCGVGGGGASNPSLQSLESPLTAPSSLTGLDGEDSCGEFGPPPPVGGCLGGWHGGESVGGLTPTTVGPASVLPLDVLKARATAVALAQYERGPGRKRRVAAAAAGRPDDPSSEEGQKKERKLKSAYVSRYRGTIYVDLLKSAIMAAETDNTSSRGTVAAAAEANARLAAQCVKLERELTRLNQRWRAACVQDPALGGLDTSRVVPRKCPKVRHLSAADGAGTPTPDGPDASPRSDHNSMGSTVSDDEEEDDEDDEEYEGDGDEDFLGLPLVPLPPASVTPSRAAAVAAVAAAAVPVPRDTVDLSLSPSPAVSWTPLPAEAARPRAPSEDPSATLYGLNIPALSLGSEPSEPCPTSQPPVHGAAAAAAAPAAAPAPTAPLAPQPTAAAADETPLMVQLAAKAADSLAEAKLGRGTAEEGPIPEPIMDPSFYWMLSANSALPAA